MDVWDRDPNKINIKVKMLYHDEIVLYDIPIDEKINKIKTIITKKFNIKDYYNLLTIVYKGNLLYNSSTIAQSKVKHNDYIICIKNKLKLSKKYYNHENSNEQLLLNQLLPNIFTNNISQISVSLDTNLENNAIQPPSNTNNLTNIQNTINRLNSTLLMNNILANRNSNINHQVNNTSNVNNSTITNTTTSNNIDSNTPRSVNTDISTTNIPTTSFSNNEQNQSDTFITNIDNLHTQQDISNTINIEYENPPTNLNDTNTNTNLNDTNTNMDLDHISDITISLETLNTNLNTSLGIQNHSDIALLDISPILSNSDSQNSSNNTHIHTNNTVNNIDNTSNNIDIVSTHTNSTSQYPNNTLNDTKKESVCNKADNTTNSLDNTNNSLDNTNNSLDNNTTSVNNISTNAKNDNSSVELIDHGIPNNNTSENKEQESDCLNKNDIHKQDNILPQDNSVNDTIHNSSTIQNFEEINHTLFVMGFTNTKLNQLAFDSNNGNIHQMIEWLTNL